LAATTWRDIQIYEHPLIYLSSASLDTFFGL
jgi:hypothetical protein